MHLLMHIPEGAVRFRSGQSELIILQFWLGQMDLLDRHRRTAITGSAQASVDLTFTDASDDEPV
jgi:hypothetical protein